jgi:hypothetical protein
MVRTRTPVIAPTALALEFTAARCDPHAVAEDKRGTFVGAHTTVDGVVQPVDYLAVPDAVVGQVHDFVAAACGW